jgi:hypothetical protein
MGFTEPQPEQIVHAATNPENGAPVMAQVNSQATPVH